jgi:hypothetical protein
MVSSMVATNGKKPGKLSAANGRLATGSGGADDAVDAGSDKGALGYATRRRSASRYRHIAEIYAPSWILGTLR